jgi:glycosyltransferase involved in cell wall biosynthesis
MKNVLYLSYTGMTEPLGQSQVLTYLIGLSKTNQYRFVIISFEKANTFKELGNEVKSLCNKAEIKWYPLPYKQKPAVLRPYLNVRKMQKFAQVLHKKYHFSFVHCRSYLPSLVGLRLKKENGLPFIFDMRGFWADERVDGGIWSLSKMIYRITYHYFKRKEKEFLTAAAHTISLTNVAKNEILSWPNSSSFSAITVIPCCVDLSIFNENIIKDGNRINISTSLAIAQNSFIICYAGSLGTWYMLDEMLNFFKQLSAKIPHAIFLVLTGEPEEMIFSAATSTGLAHDFLRVLKVSRYKIPEYLAACNMGLFFCKPVYSKIASSPVKQGEFMAMGIPVVSNSHIGDTAEILNTYNAGIVIDEFTTAAYLKAIDSVNDRSFDSNEIKNGAKDYFSSELGVLKYKRVYDNLVL